MTGFDWIQTIISCYLVEIDRLGFRLRMFKICPIPSPTLHFPPINYCSSAASSSGSNVKNHEHQLSLSFSVPSLSSAIGPDSKTRPVWTILMFFPVFIGPSVRIIRIAASRTCSCLRPPVWVTGHLEQLKRALDILCLSSLALMYPS